MRKVKKTLLTMACAGALVVGSVAATMAYLTDDDAVTNTFTVGNVQIHLDETNVDGHVEYGNCEYCAAAYEADPHHDRDHANHYEGKNKLVPGQKYVKDPTVTVLAGSEESYVRMFVQVEGMDSLKATFDDGKYYANDVFLIQYLVEGWDGDVWQFAGYTDDKGYEFRYCETVDVSDRATNVTLEALFERIVVPGDDVDSENIGNLEDVTINVTAEAIQAAGFGSADAAWGAW